MPVKMRRPKPRHTQFSALAISTFEKMEAVECTCEPIDWNGKYWARTPCEGCEEWWRLHSILWGELGPPLWQWPAYSHPNAKCPYPAGSFAETHWHREREQNPEPQELYRDLVAALKAKR